MGSSLSTAEIIGLAVGGVLAIISVVGILYTICSQCCKNDNASQVQPYAQRGREQYPPYDQPAPYPPYDPSYPPPPQYSYGPNPYAQPANVAYYPPQRVAVVPPPGYPPQKAVYP